MARIISQVVLYVLIVVGIVVTLITLFSEAYDPILYVSYGLIGVCALLAVGGGVLGLIMRPDKIVGSAIGVVALAAVIGISYAMASPEIPPGTSDAAALATNETEVLWSGAELYASYILGVAAVVVVLASGVLKMFR